MDQAGGEAELDVVARPRGIHFGKWFTPAEVWTGSTNLSIGGNDGPDECRPLGEKQGGSRAIQGLLRPAGAESGIGEGRIEGGRAKRKGDVPVSG
jgi:hypothetical protein